MTLAVECVTSLTMQLLRDGLQLALLILVRIIFFYIGIAILIIQIFGGPLFALYSHFAYWFRLFLDLMCGDWRRASQRSRAASTDPITRPRCNSSEMQLVSFASYDEKQWINALLKATWTQASTYAAAKIERSLREMLMGSHSALLQTITLESIHLGTIEPLISQVQAIPQAPHGTGIFQFDIDWASNSEVIVEMNVCGNKVKFHIKNLSVQGSVRMELRDLVEHVPFFKYARVSFTTKPKINLQLKFKDADIAHLKMKRTNMGKLASTLFRAKLIDELRTVALYPHSVDILL